MGSGTKIFLSVVGLLLVVIFIYYATIPQQSKTPAVNSTVMQAPTENDASDQQDEVTNEEVKKQPEKVEPPVQQDSLARPEDIEPRAVQSLPELTNMSEQSTPAIDDQETNNEAESTADQSAVDSGPFQYFLSDAMRQAITEGAEAQESETQQGAENTPVSEPTEEDESLDEIPSEDDEAESLLEVESKPEEAPDPEKIESAPVQQLQPPPTTEYVIKSDDTMSLIALEWFGDANKWDLIAQANPLVDPKDLRVGQIIRLPAKDTQRSPITKSATSKQIIYTVRGGDNLSRIAKAYYGNSEHWRIIYEANKVTIGIKPDRLKVGMKLVIPPAPTPAKKKDKSD